MKKEKTNKYMILEPVTPGGVREAWTAYRDNDEDGLFKPTLFETAQDAYKAAKEALIEDCMVVKRHGTQRAETITKVDTHRELF